MFRVLLAVVLLGSLSPGLGQPPGHGPGMMGGRGGHQDMAGIHALFDHHQQIKRTVNRLPNGVETVTESDDAKVQALIREHVAAMYRRLAAGQPIRQWDPLYAELFRQAAMIKMELVNTAKGLKVVETSTDPWVVQLIQLHADGVSEFIEKGWAVMHKEHPLPVPAKTATMTAIPLATALADGPDQEVKKLFDGPGRRIIQIKLRRGALLAAHKAAAPITIQCVNGSGELKTAADGAVVPLRPGVLVTIEPNVMHEIQAQPAVSILLTQFIAATAAP